MPTCTSAFALGMHGYQVDTYEYYTCSKAIHVHIRGRKSNHNTQKKLVHWVYFLGTIYYVLLSHTFYVSLVVANIVHSKKRSDKSTRTTTPVSTSPWQQWLCRWTRFHTASTSTQRLFACCTSIRSWYFTCYRV